MAEKEKEAPAEVRIDAPKKAPAPRAAKKSVKGLMSDIGSERAAMAAAADKMAAAVGKLQGKIRGFQGQIDGQKRINAAAIKELKSGIQAVASAINAQAAENRRFAREFYG